MQVVLYNISSPSFPPPTSSLVNNSSIIGFTSLSLPPPTSQTEKSCANGSSSTLIRGDGVEFKNSDYLQMPEISTDPRLWNHHVP